MKNALPMRVAFVAAALSLAVLAAGRGGAAPISQRSCAFRLSAPKGWLMYANDPFAELPDGSIVVGTTHQYNGMVSLVLRRVTQDCRVVRTFGNNGTASVGTSGSSGEIDVIHALPNGDLLVAGSASEYVELVGRLLPNGQVDHSFGTDGWTVSHLTSRTRACPREGTRPRSPSTRPDRSSSAETTRPRIAAPSATSAS